MRAPKAAFYTGLSNLLLPTPFLPPMFTNLHSSTSAAINLLPEELQVSVLRDMTAEFHRKRRRPTRRFPPNALWPWSEGNGIGGSENKFVFGKELIQSWQL